MKNKSRHFVSLFVALFLLAPFARADFSAYCDLTVAGYDANRSALANFPVLVRISETGINGFSYSAMQSDGKDLAFTSTDGVTTYPHEIDTWDTTGESLVWVLLPSMENGTAFRMNWGDPSLAAAPAYTTSGQMWVDAGYTGVWHLDEATDALFSRDSTANGLHATNNTASSVVSDGAVGLARNIGGSTSDGGLIVTNWTTVPFQNVFTASVWIRHQSSGCSYDTMLCTKSALTGNVDGWGFGGGNNAYSRFYTYGAGQSRFEAVTPGSASGGGWHKVDYVYNGNKRAIYADGESLKSGSSTYPTDSNLPLGIGCNGNGGQTWRGDLDEVRICYGIARSADWVAADYATQTDASFLTYGATVSDSASLIVIGDPENYGTAVPAYGTTMDVTAGGSLQVSVTATNLLESGVERWVCTGYTHYEITDVATGAKTVTQEGGTTSFTYVHVGQDELVWHFTNEWLVAALATVGGSVSATETWVRNGETVVLTATPETGYDFWGWSGDTDGIADASTASIVTAVTSARTLRAVFVPTGADALVQYVATTGDDANDGYSSESPKLTIQAAVDTLADAAGHGMVHVAPGLYQAESSQSTAVGAGATAIIAVTNAIAVVGDGDNPEDVVVRNTSTYNQAQVIVLYLNHPGALVANLTAEKGHRMQPDVLYGCNVSIDAAGGTVSNCVLRSGNSIGNYARGSGAWLNSDAALLTHCVVTNNSAFGTGYQYTEGVGIFVHVARGTVANCLIANNHDSGGTGAASNLKQAWANGVAVENGALLNCSVVTNEARFTAGVYLHPNGYATNVVVAGCVNKCSYPTFEEPSWSDIGFKGSLANVSHCASDGGEELDGTCVAGTAQDFFRNYAAHDYTPAPSQPNVPSLVNKGIAYDGIASLDLLGKARVQGSAPDIGAYESMLSTTLVLIR